MGRSGKSCKGRTISTTISKILSLQKFYKMKYTIIWIFYNNLNMSSRIINNHSKGVETEQVLVIGQGGVRDNFQLVFQWVRSFQLTGMWYLQPTFIGKYVSTIWPFKLCFSVNVFLHRADSKFWFRCCTVPHLPKVLDFENLLIHPFISLSPVYVLLFRAKLLDWVNHLLQTSHS